MPPPETRDTIRTVAAVPGSGHAGLLRKAIRGRPLRTWLMVTGIALSTLLVLVLLAAYRSPMLGVQGYVAQPGIDLWVTPPSTDNLTRTAGFLPLHMIDDLRGIPGVRAADPLLRVFVRATRWRRETSAGERDLMLLAIGYRVPGGLAGPPAIAMGREPRAETEVALDRAAAFRLGIGLGDTLRVNDRLVKVVGITQGTNLLATQFLFFDLALAERASGLEDRVSFFVVRTDAGKQAAVAGSIRDLFPGTAVYARDAFARNSLRESAAGFIPLLALIAILGVLVASLTVALQVQGLVEDRHADLAVLLAMGGSVRSISVALVTHASTLVLAGSTSGALIAHALGWSLDHVFPTITLSFLPLDVIAVIAIFAGAGVLGAIAPLWRLRTIDPLEAFRA